MISPYILDQLNRYDKKYQQLTTHLVAFAESNQLHLGRYSLLSQYVVRGKLCSALGIIM